MSEDAAREALSKLDKKEVLKDLDSVVQYTKTIKTANGKIISAGFCW
jgi:dienelactone hydrolase